jgi:8-oxo-dGTP diphosphatase
VNELVGTVERPGADADTVYVIDDYAADVVGGALRAGDDAREVRWVTLDELTALPLTAGLLDTLSVWQRLPARN